MQWPNIRRIKINQRADSSKPVMRIMKIQLEQKNLFVARLESVKWLVWGGGGGPEDLEIWMEGSLWYFF